MRNSKLSEKQFLILVKLIQKTLENMNFGDQTKISSEIKLTKDVIIPEILNLVQKTKEKRLNVRGEGIQPVRPIFKSTFSIKPDLEIELLGERLIAFEVKILRKKDPTGSLSKAVGQGLLYRAWGYRATFVLVIDGKKKFRHRTPILKSKISNLVDNLYIYLF